MNVKRKRFHKFVAAVTLLAFICSYPTRSEAVVGAIALGAAAGIALFSVGLVTYYKPSVLPSSLPKPAFVTTAGNIGRIMLAGWSEVQAAVTTQMKNKYVTAKLFYADLLAKVSRNDPNYPALRKALYAGDEVVEIPHAVKGDYIKGPVGQDLTVNTATFNDYVGCQATKPTDSWDFNSNRAQVYTTASPENAAGCSLPSKRWASNEITFFVGKPTPRAHTATEFRDAVRASPLNNSTLDTFSGDIDAIIQANPNIVHFQDTVNPDTETDTAPPFVAPNTVANPVAGTAATAASSASTKTAANAATAAAAVSAYAAAHPGVTVESDPAYADLVKAAAIAQALADAAANTAVDSAAQDMAAQEITATATPQTLKSIDWTPFLTISGVLASHWPFNTLSTLAANYNVLVGSGQAPVFTFPIPYGGNMTCDLAYFNPVADVIRYVLSVLIIGGLIFITVRRFTD